VPGGAPQVLGGPVWFFLQALILSSVALALFVFFDSFRPKRAQQAASLPEPLWTYTAGQGAFIATLLLAQVVKGVSWISAVPAILMLFALAQGVAYLLRVVFPAPASAATDAPGEAAVVAPDEARPEDAPTVRGESSDL